MDIGQEECVKQNVAHTEFIIPCSFFFFLRATTLLHSAEDQNTYNVAVRNWGRLLW